MGSRTSISDGASNRDETVTGTNLRRPRQRRRRPLDGEELQAGADGFITNPLSPTPTATAFATAWRSPPAAIRPIRPASTWRSALQSHRRRTVDLRITVNCVQRRRSQQLAVTGHLKDGTTIEPDVDDQRGHQLRVERSRLCNFGAPDGRVFGGSTGPCTITVTNSGFTASATGTSPTSRRRALGSVAIPGYANNVDVNGNFAYVAAGVRPGSSRQRRATRRRRSSSPRSTRPATPTMCGCVGNLAYIADGSSRPADHRRPEPAGAGAARLVRHAGRGQRRDRAPARRLRGRRRRPASRSSTSRIRRRRRWCARWTRRARRAASTSTARSRSSCRRLAGARRCG